MQKTFTATAARKNFFGILKSVENNPSMSVTITHEGHPTMVLMSAEEFDGWMETMDILSNPDEANALRAAMKDKTPGISLEDLRKSLKL